MVLPLSLLGLTLANAFLCHFERQWLSDFPQTFCPNIYKRYVGGIVVTFDSYEQLKLSNLNITIPFRSLMSRYVVKVIN